MASDMLSQEEIDALLKGDNKEQEHISKSDDNNLDGQLSELEKDALGEIGNITMGTAATTLSTLLNQKVVITTPKVSITTIDYLSDQYPIPFVAIDVRYKTGIEGVNILILKVDDVKVITDLMLGKDSFDLDRKLSDLELSAVSEAMNQMMGSACTSLSEMFSKKIDIEPPRACEITFDEGKDKFDILKNNEPIVEVSFRMVVSDVIDSEIMQLIPVDFAKDMVEQLLGNGKAEEKIENETINDSVEEDTKNIDYKNIVEKAGNKESKEDLTTSSLVRGDDTVTIRKPTFQSFDKKEKVGYNGTIDIVEEIPVEITVELGRTTKKIGEILEYGPGTIIELDKLVGEPLNVYANGKFIAKGEVVVIDDNFGIRITDIVNHYDK